jgi:hypothetical protein
MNIFALILALVPGVVQGIQTVVGDKANGATKKQMAQDALAAALSATSTVLTGNNSVLAKAAAGVASLAIDQTVSIAQASGSYNKWTAVATAAQQDTGVAAAVVNLVQSIQQPQQPAATPVAATTK